MSKDWKQWATKKGIQKWFRKDNLIVLVLVGILLFIIALPTKDSTTDEKENAVSGSENSSLLQAEFGKSSGTAETASATETDTDEAYALYLEERLKKMLSRIANVGEVQVMITLKSSRELVVEKEEPVNRSSTNESDSQGGSRIVSEVQSEENTVYRTDGSLSEPYVIKTLTPQIEGVLVVAQGAGSGTVSRTIVEIVQTLFDVEAHKVKVVKMELDG